MSAKAQMSYVSRRWNQPASRCDARWCEDSQSDDLGRVIARRNGRTRAREQADAGADADASAGADAGMEPAGRYLPVAVVDR